MTGASNDAAASQARDAPARRGGVLRSHALLLLGLPLYVGLVWLVQKVLSLETTPVGSFGAFVLVVVPALLWLTHFYLLDRNEPEPTHYVFGAFLLGALIAAPLSRFIVENLFTLSRWTHGRFSKTHFGAAFLVVGAAQELCKYVTVRYTLYLSDEFDEPADGIVYATAVGLGFAVATCFRYVMSGVVPLVGAVDATISTLSHACFSGAAGYALGRAKFARTRGEATRTLALGLLAAIVLNGSFVLLSSLARTTLTLTPWRSLALGAGYAGMVFGVISYLMKRSLSAPEAHPAPRADGAAEG